MKKLIFSLLLLSVVTVYADDKNQFQFNVSSTVLSQLMLDKNTVTFSTSMKNLSLSTPVELSTANFYSSEFNALINGSIFFNNLRVDVQLPSQIVKGEVRAPKSLSDVNVVVQQWQNRYRFPKPFKKWDVKIKKILVEDFDTVKVQYEVKSLYSYVLFVDIPIITASNTLVPSDEKFEKIGKFLHWAEKDIRSKTMFDNNKSGLPIFVVINKNGMIEARHPFHTIEFNPKKKSATYDYVDLLKDIKPLWEIQRLLKEKEVGEFLGDDFSRIQVNMSFRSNKNFRGHFFHKISSKIKLFNMENGKLSLTDKAP